MDSYNFGSQVTGVDSKDSLVFVSGVNGLTILKYGYSDPLGLIETHNLQFNLTVYPLPFKDVLNLNITRVKNNDLVFRLVTLTGSVIYTSTITRSEHSFNLKNILTPGIYYAQIIDSNTNQILATKKVVKVNGSDN